MHLISTEDIQYQPLIGIRELCILDEGDVFSCIRHNGEYWAYIRLQKTTSITMKEHRRDLEWDPEPCICFCRWGRAPSPRGWNKSQAAWSSSSGKWPHLAARAPPVHSSGRFHQICLQAHRWTADAPLPSAHSEPYRSGEWKELLGWEHCEWHQR